ncbi:MAG TPA: CAP domain-containing protein [Anaerolineales bacterium]|nr:CAP domain-containing protein [Anaerolineales bacterium]
MWRLASILALAVFLAFGSISISRAATQERPVLAGSPYDLINAVNALRATYGRTPYSISSILMYTAHAQADFLAATGSMTHSGPGGISLTDRLLAAGYPLAGDLSLGGFRSENITGGSESMSAQAAVDSWTGDSLHLTTMISPDLTEIGAGVAVSNGRVYYVIDCALPTTSDAPQAAATSIGGETIVPAATREVAVILPVTPSAPDGDGNVIHEVKPGQTLWQIAIAYEVRIDEIKSLNNLFDNNIYPGDKLFIKMGVTLPTGTPTETATWVPVSAPTGMLDSTATAYADTLTATPVVLVSSVSTDNSVIMKVTMGVIALAIFGGGIFTWLKGSRKH